MWIFSKSGLSSSGNTNLRFKFFFSQYPCDAYDAVKIVSKGWIPYACNDAMFGGNAEINMKK